MHQHMPGTEIVPQLVFGKIIHKPLDKSLLRISGNLYIRFNNHSMLPRTGGLPQYIVQEI